MDFSSIVSGVGDWFSNNSGWIKPVVSGISNLYQANNQANARNQFADLARQQEQANYDAAMADAAYYDKWMADKMGVDASNRAGAAAASAARARAAAAQAAAMNAAAKQEEQNRLRAGRKAMSTMKAGYDESTATLQPFYQQGVDALPLQRNAYESAVNTSMNLAPMINSPEFMSRITAPYNTMAMIPQAQQFNPLSNPVSLQSLMGQAGQSMPKQLALPNYYRGKA